MSHKLSQKKIRRIYKLKEKGLSCREIGDKLNLHRETVRRYCAKKFKMKKTLSEKQVRMIYDLRRKGLTCREIGEKVGCTNVCVSRYLRKAIKKSHTAQKPTLDFVDKIYHKVRIWMMRGDIQDIEANIKILEEGGLSSKIHHVMTFAYGFNIEKHIELLKFLKKQKEDQIAFREHQKIEYEEFLRKLGV